MVSRTMQEAYKEGYKFINLERELKLVIKGSSTTLVAIKRKVKVELSLKRPRQIEH